MPGANNYVEWWQLATVASSLLGIVVAVTIFAANHIIANDVSSRERDTGIIKDLAMNQEKIDVKLDTISEKLANLTVQLARFSVKMEKFE